MPLVIALPHRRAASSQRSLSRRPVRRRAPSSSSRVSRSTAPSSVSISPAMGSPRATNVDISFRRNITINHSTGSENLVYTDEEDGVQISSGSQEDEYSDEDEDEEDWDYIDEIQPSDSASRPARVKHHGVPPPAPAPSHRPQQTRRKTSHHPPVRARRAGPL